MRIIWSPLAIERAREAAAYIAADKPDAALRWLEGLFNCVDRLGRFPLSGKIVPEISSKNFRQVLYGSYRVVYRVEALAVAILTVRHVKRLFDESELD